ncbi:hypothetical protein [Salinicola rhizosphaerae]|uniref:DUF2489 domain-containing protein n=1 Tax=Salinicola rhizosphaerae TaxID=1443141 RepID=A0ABQ3DS48_9GAMM|nr:hypothetical protein [Salinicola rhizosphaerae]GHB12875.1 hypothetical protein GCM10009038_08620 [Salinicola rhizosphaerae]
MQTTIKNITGILLVSAFTSGVTFVLTYDHMIHKISEFASEGYKANKAQEAFNARIQYQLTQKLNNAQKLSEVLQAELISQCVANSDKQAIKPTACLNASAYLQQNLDFNQVEYNPNFVDEFNAKAQREFFFEAQRIQLYKELHEEAEALSQKHRNKVGTEAD